MKWFFLILFTTSHVFAINPTRQMLELHQYSERVVPYVLDAPFYGQCMLTESNNPTNEITPVTYQNLENANGNKIEMNAISLEYATTIFNQLQRNSGIPFQFQDRGCEARAHKMVQLLEEKGILAGKVVLQGKEENALQMTTQYHPKGKVEWSFHMAPIIKVRTGKKKKIKISTGWFSSEVIEVDEVIDMVIDPSTSNGPITLKEWKASLTKHNPKQKLDTFFMGRHNYVPQQKYEELDSFQEIDNDRIMSAFDIGFECINSRKNNLKDERC
jgi:hypothetical protein